ncbi:helix-turn-helix domain-containing protein [Enterococcus mediterraneensis]|uniref:helix-turn-helix domain-containing protein n=1 Tax=Enterococcus mediterraneensis TaxID=2364791 RepID=UPI000F06C030|nr:helix-turn-helix transcriptional regulator [Enterococcus mediterraneensis]
MAEIEISEVLKERRKKMGLTQGQVAERIYVSQKSISNWENGKNYPDIESLIRLAHLYELSLDQLLLEGSSLVEDIKIQAEQKTMKRMALPSLIVNLCIIVLLVSQKWWGELSLQATIILIISMCGNFVPLYYFERRRILLEKELDSKPKHSHAVLLIVVVVLFAAAAILVIPQFF